MERLTEEQAWNHYRHYLKHTVECDLDQVRMPSMCEETPDGFEMRDCDQVFAFVAHSGEVMDGDEYVIDHPDRQVI